MHLIQVKSLIVSIGLSKLSTMPLSGLNAANPRVTVQPGVVASNREGVLRHVEVDVATRSAEATSQLRYSAY
jgi:hypothetical protein